MIQRKQTLYLLAAAIVLVVCYFLRMGLADLLVLLSGVLSAATIFLYKNRILQSRLCLLSLVIVLAWYILLAVQEGRIAGITEGLPMVGAILIVLARKGIRDDEKLVRSMDRIR